MKRPANEAGLFICVFYYSTARARCPVLPETQINVRLLGWLWCASQRQIPLLYPVFSLCESTVRRGQLPMAPPHLFIGRSFRELLTFLSKVAQPSGIRHMQTPVQNAGQIWRTSLVTRRHQPARSADCDFRAATLAPEYRGDSCLSAPPVRTWCFSNSAIHPARRTRRGASFRLLFPKARALSSTVSRARMPCMAISTRASSSRRSLF